MKITAKNLTYSYNPKDKKGRKALNGVNLEIEEGDFLGIIGKTGSGKSTFVQHLNGLIKIGKNCGSLTVGDYDLTAKKCNFKELRSKVGMVFQYPEYQLFAETVFDDVAFGLKNFGSYNLQEIELLVEKAITTVGLNYAEVKDKSPFDLSGGQKRRVAIAGVIVTKPEVLVLDEPVAGLDPQGKKEFFALLHALHSDFVKTVIIVSHDMNDVAENCTKVAVFDSGKIVTVGTPSEVFNGETDLREIGLELPLTAYLEKRLQNAGVEINCGVLTEEFIKEIIRIKG